MSKVDNTLYKMEEARKYDNIENEKIQIIVDKQLSLREKALFNTQSIFHRPKASVISKENINITSELLI